MEILTESVTLDTEIPPTDSGKKQGKRLKFLQSPFVKSEIAKLYPIISRN
jgi:hypothetical protein